MGREVVKLVKAEMYIPSCGEFILIPLAQPAGLLVCELPFVLEVSSPQRSPGSGGHEEEHGKRRDELQKQCNRSKPANVNILIF